MYYSSSKVHIEIGNMLSAVSAAVPEAVTHDTRRLKIDLDDDGHGGRFELQGTVAS